MPNLSKAALDLIKRQQAAAASQDLALMASEGVLTPDEMDPPADYDERSTEYDPYV